MAGAGSPPGTVVCRPEEMERSAVFRGWSVPEAVRRRVIARAALDLRSDDPKVRHRASMVLVRCVGQDIALLNIQSGERTAKLQAQTVALQTAYAAALADPRVRELLHQLDGALVDGTARPAVAADTAGPGPTPGGGPPVLDRRPV